MVRLRPVWLTNHPP